MTDLNFATANFLQNSDRERGQRPTISSATFGDSIIESDLASSDFDSYSDFDELTSHDTPVRGEDQNCMISSGVVANILSNLDSEDPEQEIENLLADDAVSIFMQSAKVYASHAGISEQDAVSEIVAKLSRLENLWKELLVRKGIRQLENECNS